MAHLIINSSVWVKFRICFTKFKSFLASVKVASVNDHPYSPDLSPSDFCLFPRHKKMLSRMKNKSIGSLDSVIYQRLQRLN